MTGVALHYELENFQALRKRFDPKIVEKSLELALNVAARKARVQISKDVRQTYTVKAGDLTKAVQIRRLKLGKGQTARLLLYRGGVLGLDKFSPSKRVIKSASGKRRGVSVRVRKDRGRKVVTGAFIANVHGEKIFQRKGGDRLPIERKYGPSIPQMVSNKLIIDEVSRQVGENVAIEFNRQMVRLTQGAR